MKKGMYVKIEKLNGIPGREAYTPEASEKVAGADDGLGLPVVYCLVATLMEDVVVGGCAFAVRHSRNGVVAAGIFKSSRVKMARNYGGSATVSIPPGRKLVTATWKNDDLWYLTRPMNQGEVPEAYEFKESSSYGLVEGTVKFVESK